MEENLTSQNGPTGQKAYNYIVPWLMYVIQNCKCSSNYNLQISFSSRYVGSKYHHHHWERTLARASLNGDQYYIKKKQNGILRFSHGTAF